MYRILVVEDEEFYRKFLIKILQKKYRCDAAKNAIEAKGLLQRNSYDIVIYDLRLPRISGKELIRFVRREVDPDIVNIVITGYEEDWTPVEATEENIFYYLKKGGFGPEDLLKIIDSACQLRKLRTEEKKYISDQIATEGIAHAGKLAASIAHEINNPLQSLYLVIGSLKEKIDSLVDRKSMIKDLRLMERGVERIRLIVKQLLHLYRIDCSQNGIDHADAVIKKAVSFLRPIAREQNAEIVLSKTVGNEKVLVSSDYFFYALVNICMKVLDDMNRTIKIDPRIDHESARIVITTTLKDSAENEAEFFQKPDYGITYESILSKRTGGNLGGSVMVQKRKNGRKIVLTLPLLMWVKPDTSEVTQS